MHSVHLQLLRVQGNWTTKGLIAPSRYRCACLKPGLGLLLSEDARHKKQAQEIDVEAQCRSDRPAFSFLGDTEI